MTTRNGGLDPFRRDDDEGSDDEHNRMKKKKKKKVDPASLSMEIGKMKAKVFTPKELFEFERVLWRNPIDRAASASDATAALRRRLGLRVPDVRRHPCKFWLKGNCARGAACSFAHVAEGQTADAAPTPQCPPPIQSLADPGLPKCIGRAMIHFGHRDASAIQAQAWPAALCGHDLLCRAPTGSGKTLAYLLPAAAHALAAPPPRAGLGPSALILVPTRELAMQVTGLAHALRRPCGVSTEAVYGGEPREDQAEALESSGIHLLIATAGRLVDMLMTKQASLSRTTLLVLDEADQLLTLGFSLQVNQILSQIRPDRQTLLFSATLSERLEVAAGSWLKAPMRVYAEERNATGTEAEEEDGSDEVDGGGDDDKSDDGDDGDHGDHGDGRTNMAGGGAQSEQLSEVPQNIEQRFVLCDDGGKTAALLELLESLGHSVRAKSANKEEVGDAPVGRDRGAGAAPAPAMRNVPRVMCFVNEIRQLKKLHARLKGCGVRVAALHGEKSQRERDDALRLFKAGATPVLLTSDLGSRGLDVPRLPAVVNYDPPGSASQYVHRAGRTGRQGVKGLVVSLLRRDGPSRQLAAQVQRMYRKARAPLPPAIASLLPPERDVLPPNDAQPDSKAAAPARDKKRRREKETPAEPGVSGFCDLMSFARAVGESV